MLQFHAKFTRYDAARGERRITAPYSISADDFRAAHSVAEHILSGMRGADPIRDYVIASIECAGIRAIDCNGGTMWETMEEFSARVEAEGRS